MMLGNIQRLKVVVGRFNLRPLHHAEADREENALQLFGGLPDQVARSNCSLDTRKGKIDALARLRRCFGRRFDCSLTLGQRRFHVRLELV